MKPRLVGLAVILLAAIWIVWGKAANHEKRRDPPEERAATTESNPVAPVLERDTAEPSAEEEPPAAPPEPPSDAGVRPASYGATRRARNVERLDARWRDGVPDAAWTRRTEDRLVQQFTELQIPGEVTQVDCRSTMCLVRMSFKNLADARQLYRIQKLPGYDMYPDARAGADGSVVTVYIAPLGTRIKDTIFVAQP